MIKNQNKKVYKRRAKLKQMALDYMGKKCQICGYDKCSRALVFHHINPEEKDFNIYSANCSWDKIKKELDKCILLCSNCHAEIHDKIDEKIDIDELYPDTLNNKKLEFNKEMINLALKHKTTKEKIIESRIYKRKVDRPSIDEFYKIFQSFDRNYTKTGKYFGVSDNAIRKWIKSYNKYGF